MTAINLLASLEDRPAGAGQSVGRHHAGVGVRLAADYA